MFYLMPTAKKWYVNWQNHMKLQNLVYLRTIKPDFHQILIDLTISTQSECVETPNYQKFGIYKPKTEGTELGQPIL